MTKLYKVTIRHESFSIEANNEDEAREKFYEDIESEPQQSFATFIDELIEVKEVKEGEVQMTKQECEQIQENIRTHIDDYPEELIDELCDVIVKHYKKGGGDSND